MSEQQEYSEELFQQVFPVAKLADALEGGQNGK